MSKRKIEVFTAGCFICDNAVEKIKELACPNCEVVVYDLNSKCESNICEEKAKEYGVRTLPSVAIDGELADCCNDKGIDFKALQEAGLGKA
ncbi:glutaredoxin [Halanaerobiaceae bacterium Z-7014]|uniref:Glutaredoxin n=1 Tax=Halonatronomonas betaini TaxID=2778430 RepID=A0A931AQT7_9FIRM|nr:hypothetical protein [Halonatronomonas betaini]MBF8436116.1 glutaredoxin [Halonatronomonas betaini]